MRIHHPGKTSDTEPHRRTATPAPRPAASVDRYAVGNVPRSPGQPLAAPRPEKTAARLGADFSRVRVHTDSAAVGHRVATGLVQAKLSVGPAGDRYEQEAGRMAGEVMRELRRESVEPVSVDNAVQIEARDAERGAVLPARRQIQAKAAGPVIGLEGGELDTGTDAAIRQAKGQGKPLEQRVRRSMEAGFGADFSGVRVHTDADADDLNQRIQAKAFTSGSDIFFGKGLYSPSSTVGQELLAHELTHTLQQGATMRSPANIQRAETGLEKKGAIGTFSEKVKARTTAGRNPLGSVKEWDGLSEDARAAKLAKYVNAELVKTHVPEVGYELDAHQRVGNATFNFQTWKLSIGSSGLGGNMSDDEIAELADTIYHEARHAEQWFRIARLRAGDSPQPTSADLATSLFIPPQIAEAALDRPLEPLTKLQQFFHSKGYVARQQVKMAEAKLWYVGIYGTGQVHRNDVLSDIIHRHNEYLALAEEVDAWRVGGKAKAKVKQLIDNHRVKQAAAAAAAAPAVGTP